MSAINSKLDTGDKFLTIVSDPRKAMAILILIAGTILLIYFVWRLVKKTVSNVGTSIGASAALATEIASGGNLSYSDNEYEHFAARIYKAVKGVGTDEEAIYQIFAQMRTKADVLKLIQTFGLKDNMTLTEWLYDDLNAKELDKVNSILSAQGIDYRF
ncbi:MAG TPA: hypothetical protein PK495_08330 [Bacteroidales bacterium]|nr:hypothetical protein [Bacteroidales bacterium]HQB20565.1 hypothetical protein [Bacteroidales bacterium]